MTKPQDDSRTYQEYKNGIEELQNTEGWKLADADEEPIVTYTSIIASSGSVILGAPSDFSYT